jgi:uncharacterized protein Yka (UPF0111/DUF47 family)
MLTIEERIEKLEAELEKLENNLQDFAGIEKWQTKAMKQKKAIEKKIEKVLDKIERAGRQLL